MSSALEFAKELTYISWSYHLSLTSCRLSGHSWHKHIGAEADTRRTQKTWDFHFRTEQRRSLPSPTHVCCCNYDMPEHFESMFISTFYKTETFFTFLCLHLSPPKKFLLRQFKAINFNFIACSLIWHTTISLLILRLDILLFPEPGEEREEKLCK